MKYKGIELTEFTSDKPVVFDPPRKMLCWDYGCKPCEDMVDGYFPNRSGHVLGSFEIWTHCAEIPEEPKPRRATNRELAKWLAQGNGQFTSKAIYAWASLDVVKGNEDSPCNSDWRVRKWDDTEWHEPTVDYMGLEG